MAAPNLINVTTLTGKTAVQSITTTATVLVENAADSGKCYKISSLYISNVQGSIAADVTIDIYRSSTAYRMGKTIVVPPDTTLDLINKSIYLEEGDALRLTSSSSGYLEAVCGYEIIS